MHSIADTGNELRLFVGVHRSSVVASDVDIGLEWMTIIWCVRGFVVGGLPDADQQERPRNVGLQRFRTHLHKTADYMFRITC